MDAGANCTSEEFGDMTKLDDPARQGMLIYDLPTAKQILEMPPLVAQVYQKAF